MRIKILCCLLFCVYSGSLLAQEIIVLDTISRKEVKEAILILPGFGDSKKGRKHQKNYFQHRGYDLYIPIYKDNETLENCMQNLLLFYNTQQLEKYDKIHVFSYIIGSWTLNNFINEYGRKNIATVVYDRSPIQERAPHIAANNLKLLLRLMKVKKIMDEMAATPYPSIKNDSIRIGIIIENKATPFMRMYKKKALKLGPFRWGVDALGQPYDDYFYTWLNHDQMYDRFDVIGKEVLSFMDYKAFTKSARRVQYDWDPFISYKKEGLK
jgi:hypothetical protein